ncbi:hypothetical protein Y032_0026g1345 [Ancylostoma ceylanicum]|nr:hypothetical protein Y032_0026g1345 [Ancylostoma ceylanicum]
MLFYVRGALTALVAFPDLGPIADSQRYQFRCPPHAKLSGRARNGIQKGTLKAQVVTDQCCDAAWHSGCLMHSPTNDALMMLSDTLCSGLPRRTTGQYPYGRLEFPYR